MFEAYLENPGPPRVKVLPNLRVAMVDLTTKISMTGEGVCHFGDIYINTEKVVVIPQFSINISRPAFVALPHNLVYSLRTSFMIPIESYVSL